MPATRPRHFFRADGPMPATLTLHLVVPPELDDPARFRAELRRQVATAEAAAAAERRRTGAGVLGRRAVLRQIMACLPHEPGTPGQLRPRLAARSSWARIEALLRNRQFLAAYREARERWIAGELSSRSTVASTWNRWLTSAGVKPPPPSRKPRTGAGSRLPSGVPAAMIQRKGTTSFSGG